MNNNIQKNELFLHTIKKHGTCLFIDNQAIINNYQIIKNIIPNTSEISCVLKNNAYGLGVENIVPLMKSQNCNKLFVATLEEGIPLKRYHNTAQVYILNGIFQDQAEDIYHNNFIPVLNTVSQVIAWVNFAKTKQLILPCILHIESGINRLGLTKEDVLYLHQHSDLFQYLNILYIMSHFACSDLFNHPSVEQQYNTFKELITYLPKTKYSLAASYAFVNQKYCFDMVRVAIALYGGNPTPYKENPMQHVVYFYSSIQQIKTIKKNESVGYSYLWTAERDSKLAVIPVGYADGVARSMTDGYIYIENHKAPIVGRISMDLITVDITDIPSHLQIEGQIVELIGNHTSLGTFARSANTIYSDILNTLTTRYPRIYGNL